MISRRTLARLPLALPLVAAAPRRASAATKELRFRLVEDPETLYNVQSVSLTVNAVLTTYLLDRLVYLGADGTPQPWLAESWSVSEDSRQVTFKLRRGVLFHDGTEFNADAVKFHFDSILDPKNASPVRPMMASLEGVEVLDPYTARFLFSRPFAAFLTLMGYAFFAPNSPTAVQKAGRQYGRRPVGTGPYTARFSFNRPFAAFLTLMGYAFFAPNSPTAVQKAGRQYGRRPVGTGPYMLKSWTPGSELVFVRNPRYRQLRADAANKGAPYADQVTLSVIPEEGVAFSALQTGELTAAELQTDAVGKLEGDGRFAVVVDRNAKNLLFLEFSWRPPFDDPRVREAVGRAIDRDAVVRACYSGYAAPALSPLSRGIPGYDDAVAQQYGLSYDPAKARALLADAGWAPGAGGVLAKDGHTARFALRSYANPVIDRALAVIQANLAAIGIQVGLATSDWGTFYPSLLKSDWDMDLNRWTYSDPVVLTTLFRPPGHRRTLPADPALEKVLDEVSSTLDPAARQRAVSEAQKALLERRTVVPVATNHNVYITQAGLQNFKPDYLNSFIVGDFRMADW